MHIVSDCLSHVHILYHDLNVNSHSKSASLNISPSKLPDEKDSSSSHSNVAVYSTGASSSVTGGSGDAIDAASGISEVPTAEEIEEEEEEDDDDDDDDEEDFFSVLCPLTSGPNLFFIFSDA